MLTDEIEKQNSNKERNLKRDQVNRLNPRPGS